MILSPRPSATTYDRTDGTVRILPFAHDSRCRSAPMFEVGGGARGIPSGARECPGRGPRAEGDPGTAFG